MDLHPTPPHPCACLRVAFCKEISSLALATSASVAATSFSLASNAASGAARLRGCEAARLC